MGSRHRRSSLSSSSSSCSSVKSSILLRKIGNRNSEMDNSRSSAGGGSIRIHHLTASTKEGLSRFPKLEDCAHFHYEHVELAPLQVSLYEQDDLKSLSSLECNENSENKWLVVKVVSQGQSWLLRRTYENFRMLDQQLHQCIYDRKFSALPELPPLENLPEKQDPHAYIKRQLTKYCERFSCIAGSLINCGPVLSWFQLDNRGRRILVTDDDNCPINTPAVAAAYVIKKYTAIASDEISFEIGDMISVIDMPPPEDSIWWRGKRGFFVGFFPSQCVAVITDKVPRNLQLNQPNALIEPTKPVLRKHGKLIAFFRAFILSRPSRRHLKQAGILKERVFGCDLGEHLLNTGRDIPMVLKCCTEFIEQHGIVDGIYRLSGVTSNIQKLRITFDEDRMPILYNDDNILQDIHSVASLLKMYFRELPNPLCTYQLYKSFVSAVQHSENSERIVLMKDTVQKLPPPHYRTLEYLMKHLARVAEHGTRTGMTARNIAIVWAPNLLRCKELEVGGVAALQGVGVQAVVTEFLITHVEHVFSIGDQQTASHGTSTRRVRPKSLSLGTPTKLLSLEEAQVKKSIEPTEPDNNYIEVGGGPSCLPEKYHTVIELPSRKRSALKRSPLGWKSLFTRNMYSTASGIRKSASSVENKRKTSVPDEITNVEQEGAVSYSDTELKNKLRPVKSAESLSNNSNELSVRNSVVINECLSPPSPKTAGIIATAPGTAGTGHSRSVSHDSYFDQLGENTPLHMTLQAPDEEGLSDLIVNFDLDESEMKVFSDDESTQVFSNRSSLERFQLTSKQEAKLASSENTITADPSPKRHKTSDNGSFSSVSFSDDVTTAVSNKRSRLEERLSGVDFAFIDSHGGNGPEYIVVEVDVHRAPSIVNGDDGCTGPESFVSSPMTDITYSDSLSGAAAGYTLSDAVMNGYTPLSEESYCSDIYSTSMYTKSIEAPSSSRSSYASLQCSSGGGGVGKNKYENFPRNRHSYQGGEMYFGKNDDHNNNNDDGRSSSNRSSLQRSIIAENHHRYDNLLLCRKGYKSLSDACLTKQQTSSADLITNISSNNNNNNNNNNNSSRERSTLLLLDNSYEYVSTDNNNINDDKANEAYSSNYAPVVVVTVDSSNSSLNEIDHNRYEYVSTTFNNNNNNNNKSNSPPLLLNHRQRHKQITYVNCRDDQESGRLYLNDPPSRLESSSTIDSTTNENNNNNRLSSIKFESPYEPVSVVDNILVVVSSSGTSSAKDIIVINETADSNGNNSSNYNNRLLLAGGNDLSSRKRLIDSSPPDIDSNYEDFSNLVDDDVNNKAVRLNLSSLDDDRSCSPDDEEGEAMVENNLYESLIADDEDEQSSPEVVKRRSITTLYTAFDNNNRSTSLSQDYDRNGHCEPTNFADDKDNCYEKFVENEYYEDETCCFLKDNQPLLASSENPSPFSDDDRIIDHHRYHHHRHHHHQSCSSSYENNQLVPLLLAESPDLSIKSNNNNNNNNNVVLVVSKPAIDHNNHDECNKTDSPPIRMCHHRDSESNNLDLDSGCRSFGGDCCSSSTIMLDDDVSPRYKESSSPMHQALQKLQEGNEASHTVVSKEQGRRGDGGTRSKEQMKNVHELLSKFEWRHPIVNAEQQQQRGGGVRQTAATVLTEEKKQSSVPSSYVKRNSDSKLYRNCANSNNNNRSINNEAEQTDLDDRNKTAGDRNNSTNVRRLTQTTSLETVKCRTPSPTLSRVLAVSEPSTVVTVGTGDDDDAAASRMDGNNKAPLLSSLDAIVRRERIEKYKEERRLLLRQKYKTDNIKDVNDEREQEMIKRFKQKISSSPSISCTTSNSNGTSVNESYSSKIILTDDDAANNNNNNSRANKPNRPKHLALNTTTTSSSDNKNIRRLLSTDDGVIRQKSTPAAPCSTITSNVTTINILYSPTRNYSSEEGGHHNSTVIVGGDSAVGTSVLDARYCSSTSNDDQKTTKRMTDKKEDGGDHHIVNSTTFRSSLLDNKTTEDRSDSSSIIGRRRDEDSAKKYTTTSLERSLKRGGGGTGFTSTAKMKDKMESFVAQRVNQLSSTTATIGGGNINNSINDVIIPPIASKNLLNVVDKQNNPPKPIRRRAHSTSGPVTQYCIRDIAAIFENK